MSGHSLEAGQPVEKRDRSRQAVAAGGGSGGDVVLTGTWSQGGAALFCRWQGPPEGG